MRRLHAVGKHEKFVASGLYAYRENGVDIRLREQWSIHEVGGGAHFIRADVDGREHDGHSTLIEALQTPDGCLERIDQQIFEPGSSRPVKLSYIMYDEHVELVVNHQDQRIENAITMPPEYGIFVYSQLISGFTIKRAVQQPEKITLLHVFLQEGNLAWGRFETAVNVLESEKLAVVDGRELPVDCLRWQEDVTVCVDQHGVNLHTESPTTQARLTQYARRPEPNPS